MLWAISYPCSSLARPRIHDALKMSSFYLVATAINEKVGWMGNCLMGGPRKVHRMFAFEGRNVAFVIDNCPAHPHIDNLKAIKLYFLPPNTISKTKLMDQGVIRSLTVKYRKNVVRKIINSVEKKKNPPQISLLQGMQMLVSTWDALSTQTMLNCIRKSGISTESQETAITEDDDPYRNYKTKLTTFALTLSY